jgi:hypothetical protein
VLKDLGFEKQADFEKDAFWGLLARAGSKILPYALRSAKAMRRFGGRPVRKKMRTSSYTMAKGLAKNPSSKTRHGFLRRGVGELGFNMETALRSPRAYARNLWTQTGTASRPLQRSKVTGLQMPSFSKGLSGLKFWKTKKIDTTMIKGDKRFYKSRLFGVKKEVTGFTNEGKALVKRGPVTRTGAVLSSGPAFGAVELIPGKKADGTAKSLGSRAGHGIKETAAWTLAPGLAQTAMIGRLGFEAVKGTSKALKKKKQINNNLYY